MHLFNKGTAAYTGVKQRSVGMPMRLFFPFPPFPYPLPTFLSLPLPALPLPRKISTGTPFATVRTEINPWCVTGVERKRNCKLQIGFALL